MFQDMAARSQPTPGLGRSGSQVVKKGMHNSENDVSDARPAVGSKRSARDRLGRNVGDSFSYEDQPNNKRLRGDDVRAGLSTNGVNDLHIGEDDLRFQIIQKNMFRRTQNDALQDKFDLRDNLLRMVQPSMNSNRMRHPLPETKEPNFSTRNAGDLPHIAPMRNSFSPWNLEQLRRRSSDDESLSSRSSLSPQPSNAEEFQKKSFDNVKSVENALKNVDPVRAVVAAPLTEKSKLLAGSVKPTTPVPSLIPQVRLPCNNIHKSSNMGDEQSSIDRLLKSLGLEKYSALFKVEEVDMVALKQMGDHDLKELGIPMVLLSLGKQVLVSSWRPTSPMSPPLSTLAAIPIKTLSSSHLVNV